MDNAKELEQQATKLLVENGYDREGRDYKADQVDPLIIWYENEAILQVEGSKSFTTQRNHFATDPKREIEGRKPYGLTKINALARDYYPCHSSIDGWFNALDQKVLASRKGKAAKQAAQKSNSKKTANKARPKAQKYQSQAEKQKAYRQRKRQEQKMNQTISPGQTFNTKYESGCKAITEPDNEGRFIGLDSDGVECDFSVEMVT